MGIVKGFWLFKLLSFFNVPVQGGGGGGKGTEENICRMYKRILYDSIQLGSASLIMDTLSLLLSGGGTEEEEEEGRRSEVQHFESPASTRNKLCCASSSS